MPAVRTRAGPRQGGRSRRRLLGFGAVVLAGLLPPIPILPGPSPPPSPPGAPSSNPVRLPIVRIATTGDHSELVRTIPIARRGRHSKHVVMSLGRKDGIPSLRPGDRVKATAEVEVSTTCVERSPRCIGGRYDYNPKVTGRLVLANRRGKTGGKHAMRISGRKQLRCRQARPNRNHHCVLVFTHAKFKVRRGHRPCGGFHCHLNLALSASNPNAGRNDKLVVGVDMPHGRVSQDRGRVNLIRVRRPDGSGKAKRAASAGRARTPLRDELPVGHPGDRLEKRVVYSMRLPNLKKGEKLSVAGKLRSSVEHLESNVRISSRLILAGRSRATKPGRKGRRFGFPHGEISEMNGFNCTQGQSAYRTPCLTKKVGVMRVKRNAVDSSGDRRPLFVNLVAGANATLEPPGGASAKVTGGSLKVIRYAGD
jgi:hypothetical protein